MLNPVAVVVVALCTAIGYLLEVTGPHVAYGWLWGLAAGLLYVLVASFASRR